MKSLLSILLVLIVPIFGITSDGGNEQPDTIKDHFHIDSVITRDELMTKKIVGEWNEINRERSRPEFDIRTLSTDELIDFYMYGAFTLQAICTYHDQVTNLFQRKEIKELITRDDCVERIICIYKSLLDTQKEYVTLLLSSDKIVEIMNKDQKYVVMQLAYDIFSKDRSSLAFSNRLSIPFILKNILLSEGYTFSSSELTFSYEMRWDPDKISLFKEWKDEIISNTENYLRSKNKTK